MCDELPEEVDSFHDLGSDWLDERFLETKISISSSLNHDFAGVEFPHEIWPNIDVCVFHAPCSDGTAAAFAVGTRYPECRFFGVNRGSGDTDCFLPEGLDNNVVLLVDYVYSEALMIELIQNADKVYVIDHHASEEDLLNSLGFKKGSDLIFSLNHSASLLAWKFFQSSPIPPLFAYINDNDIGAWQLRNVGKFMAGFAVQGIVLGPGWSELRDFSNFQISLDRGPNFIRAMIVLGLIAYEIEWRDVYTEAQRCVDKRLRVSPEFVCRVLNVSASVKAGPLVRALLEGSYSGYAPQPKADLTFLYYKIDKNASFKVSLRSNEGCDVGLIAQQLGGGGHVHAASFTCYGNLDELFLSPEQEKEWLWQQRLQGGEDELQLCSEIEDWMNWYENKWDWSMSGKIDAMRNNFGYPLCVLERRILFKFPQFHHHLFVRGYELHNHPTTELCQIGQLKEGDFVFFNQNLEVCFDRSFADSWTVDSVWPVVEDVDGRYFVKQDDDRFVSIDSQEIYDDGKKFLPVYLTFR